MASTPMLAVVIACTLGAAAGQARSTRPAPRQERASADTVVFVCEHGSVKSLMAREWFERRARERGLSLRAVSRGMTPDASVPDSIREALGRDGFDVSGFEPRALAPGDQPRAARVVAIGIDPSPIASSWQVPIEVWDGIPPATQQYEAAREALRARIEALLTALENAGR